MGPQCLLVNHKIINHSWPSCHNHQAVMGELAGIRAGIFRQVATPRVGGPQGFQLRRIPQERQFPVLFGYLGFFADCKKSDQS